MPLLSEYLNLSLMKPFCSQKSKYLTMTCSDVIGTETGEVSLPILEVISVTYKKRFFPGESKIKIKSLVVGIIYRLPNQSNFLEIINANFDKRDTNTKRVAYHW